MAEMPYFVAMRVALAGNASATLSHTVPRQERLRVIELRVVSTGAFSITNIRDSAGMLYGNMSPSTPLLSTALQAGTSGNIGFSVLPVALDINGSTIIYFDITDTSGAANTVNIFLSCVRITP